LQRSFFEHGKEAFEFRVIEEGIPEALLDSRERSWIQYYKSTDRDYGYNRETGGHLNKHLSDETRRKISEAHKGIMPSEKTRKLLSVMRMGKKHSEDTCRRISEAQMGKKLSRETRKRISEAHMGKNLSEETRRKISESCKGNPWSTARREAQLRRRLKDAP